MKLPPRLMVVSGLASVAVVMFTAVAMAHMPSGSADNAPQSHDHSTPDNGGSSPGQPAFSAAAPAPSAGNGNGQVHPPKKPETPEQAKAKGLLEQGYESIDVYTALNLERRTGIDAVEFLKERKKGTEWPQVVDKVAPGRVLKREAQKDDSPVQVDQAVMDHYQTMGYTYLDVLDAARLARDYDLPLESVFARKRPDRSWLEVEVDLATRNSTPPADGRMDLRFGPEGRETTVTGMHKQEIYRLMDQGYDLADILRADQMTMRVEATVEEILAQAASGMDWEAIRQMYPAKPLTLTDDELVYNTGLDSETVRALRQRGFSAEDLLRANRIARERGASMTTVLDELDRKGRNWNQIEPSEPTAADLERTTGIPRQQIEELLQQGATWKEIVKAHSQGQKDGRPFGQLVKELIQQRGKPVKHLDQLSKVQPDGTAVETDRTRSGMTLDEVNQLLQEFEWIDIDTADLWAERLGTSAAKLLHARKKGMEWDQIVDQFYAEEHGTPLAALTAALGVPVEFADEIGFTTAEYNELVALGLNDEDILRAGLIAKATGLPVAEVARVKTADMTWLDVALTFKKGGKK